MRFTLPKVTRAILALLVVVSVVWQVSAARRAGLGLDFRKSTLVPWVSLTPQTSWKYPWVYITATFAEQNLFTLGVAAAWFYFGGKYLERAWGEQELGRFIALLTILPTLITSLLYLAAYGLTRSSNLLNTSIQGSIAIQAGFLVTLKQLVPEHTVSLLRGAVRIRVKHFPAIFLLANTISGFVLFTDTAAILAWAGFLTAWTYLRFFQQRSDDLNISAGGGSEVKGDASETFAFAYFWPDKIHAPIAAVSDATFKFFVSIGLCTPFSADEVQSSTQEARLRAEGGLPTVNRGGDAERRTAIALQALNERLNQGRQPAPPPPMTANVPRGSVAADEQSENRSKSKFTPEWSNDQP